MYSHSVLNRVSTYKSGYVQIDSSGNRNYKQMSVGGYASSVYAGAGGLGTRISGAVSHTQVAANPQFYNSRGLSISGNEKGIMQNLNDRLATYMDKVHSLEMANAQLEGQIRDWYKKNSGLEKRDDEHYFQVIEELTKKIESAKMENGILLIQMDNARLASEDFRKKLENEEANRAMVENDLFKLRKAIDDLTMSKADLESQIESFKEELVYLNKNHAEELDGLHKQASSIDVEVDAAPAVDLAKIMEEIRSQYEQLVETQRLEEKCWFDKKVEEWNLEMQVTTTDLEEYKKDLVELKQKAQSLEIESQAETSKRKATSNTLEYVNCQYKMELADKQEKIAHFEELLQQTRKDVGNQIYEFGMLFDMKTRLEAEIATYQKLLEAEGH